MNFIPLSDRVRIEPDGVKTVTELGYDIPTSAQERPVTGTVISKGDKVTIVEVGDRVVYSEHSGVKVNVDGEDIVYIKESDCHFIIEGNKND